MFPLRRVFGRHLLLTNTVSCGVFLATGDLIQQSVEIKRRLHGAGGRYDWRRTGRMFVVGLIQGPPHHYWYLWLDRWLPARSVRAVSLKIAADQLVAAPLFALLFFTGMSLVEKLSLSAGVDEFVDKFPLVYLFDWCIWPASQFVNFRFVPAHLRVTYVNAVTVLWDVFLSYIKHRDHLESSVIHSADHIKSD